ncbi:MAG: hypothetical protein ABSG91_23715 [Syntrophobacteraceae bacterium]
MSQTHLPTKRPVVVILGMHRSGTSLVANFVHAIGVDLGNDLMPANEWNAAGYWESRKIWEAHEKILKELNCDWHNPPLSLPANWWRKPAIQELKNGLLEFVRSECKRTEKLWGFKDPRTAILLPLWREIFDELQLKPLYILSVRHPGSVAASLARRDRLGLANSQALWLKTYLDALTQTRHNQVGVVDYDRWFGSGMEQARTVIESLSPHQSISEEQIADAVNQTIHSGLRHHSSEHNERFLPIVERSYSLLKQAAVDGKVPDEIWNLTETFEKTKDILSIWEDLVAERDAIITERDQQMDWCKKKYRIYRKFLYYSYAVFLILVIVYFASSFVLK